MSTKQRVKDIARAQGRKLNWLGRQIGVADRRVFDTKLKRDSFTLEQRQEIAKLLGVPVDYLFPVVEPAPEVTQP